MNLLFPKLSTCELKQLIAPCLSGALFASLFGIVIDQLSYSISSEYFTKFKYLQFSNIPLSTQHRINAAIIGALGTWWVGLFVGWFVGRWHLLQKSKRNLKKSIYCSFALVFVSVQLFLLIGYTYGLVVEANISNSNIAKFANSLGVSDISSFVRVAYFNNFGYFGALVGLITFIFLTRKSHIKLN